MKQSWELYELYAKNMREDGLEVNSWDSLPQTDKNGWTAVAMALNKPNTTQMKVDIDASQISGMGELIMTADQFVANVDLSSIGLTDTIVAFKSALDKIGSQNVDLASITTIRGPKDKPAEFYHMDGKPQQFDIDEELGELLIACMRGLEFIHSGPAIQTTEDVIQSMYESHVAKLIPKLEATIANRIIVKYPFHALVDELFGKLYQCQSKRPLDQMNVACGVIENGNDRMLQGFENFTVGDKIAETTIAELANMIIAMQQIMNIFGWTWDDVKLKARQQLSVVK